MIFQGSGTSEDSNYESLRLYEEINDCQELGNRATTFSSVPIKNSQSYSENYNENLPPSILRPPDISEIFLRLWNENNSINRSADIPTNSINTDGSSHPIIPRPKVGWPSRKVTFGKCNSYYLKKQHE